MGPRNNVSDGVQLHHGKAQILSGNGVSQCYMYAMRPLSKYFGWDLLLVLLLAVVTVTVCLYMHL